LILNVSYTRAVLSELNLANNNFVGTKDTGELTAKTYYSDGDTDEEGGKEVTELDFGGVTALVDAISNNTSLTTVNMLGNKIGAEQAGALAVILPAHPTLKSLCGHKGNETVLNLSGMGIGAEGALMLAPEIAANEALTSLSLANNDLGEAVAPKALPVGWTYYPDGAWKYQHSDGRKQDGAPGGRPAGVLAVAGAIKRNGGLLSVDLSNNAIKPEPTHEHPLVHATGLFGHICDGCNQDIFLADLAEAYQCQQCEFDLCQACHEAECSVKALAGAFQANIGLVSVNMLNNKIGTKHVENLVAVFKTHGTLKSMCGNRGGETELDMSNKIMGAVGAIMLAPEISANTHLSKLDVSNNDIGTLVKSPGGWTQGGGGKYRSPVGKMHDKKPDGEVFEPVGAIALTNAIENNNALTVINVMGNKIGKEQLSKLQEIMRAKAKCGSLCGIDEGATDVALPGQGSTTRAGKVGIDGSDTAVLAAELWTRSICALNLNDNVVLSESQNIDSDPSIPRKVGEMVMFQGIQRPISYILSSKKGYRVYMLEGLLALANAIKDNVPLSKLVISKNKLGKCVDAGKAFAEALAANTLLEELDLSENDCGAEFTAAFLPGLAANGALTKLNLAGNHINRGVDTEAAAALGKDLADALAVNTVLKELNLCSNHLRPEFMSEFAVGLRYNHSLYTLDLGDNRLEDAGAMTIADVLGVAAPPTPTFGIAPAPAARDIDGLWQMRDGSMTFDYEWKMVSTEQFSGTQTADSGKAVSFAVKDGRISGASISWISVGDTGSVWCRGTFTGRDTIDGTYGKFESTDAQQHFGEGRISGRFMGSRKTTPVPGVIIPW
jgi:Leucine-rich repeat (LRR) protein